MTQRQNETAHVPLWVWGALLLTAAVVGPILATSLGARAHDDPQDPPKYVKDAVDEETPDDSAIEPDAKTPVENRTASNRKMLPAPQLDAELEDEADSNVTGPVVSKRRSRRVVATAAEGSESPTADDSPKPGPAAPDEAAPPLESPSIPTAAALPDEKSAEEAPQRAASPAPREEPRERADSGEEFRGNFTKSESKEAEEPQERVDHDEHFRPRKPSPRRNVQDQRNAVPVDSTLPQPGNPVRAEVHANRTADQEPADLPVRPSTEAAAERVESRFAQLMQANPAWRRIQMTYSHQGSVPMVQLAWGTCRIRAYRMQIGATSMVASRQTGIQLASVVAEPPLDVKLNDREMQVSLPGIGDLLTSSSISLKLEGLGLHPETIDAFLSEHEIQVSAGEYDKHTPAVTISAGPLQILAADVHLEDVVGAIDITADAGGVSVKREDFSIHCTKFKLKGDTLTLSARGQGRIVIEEMREPWIRTPAAPQPLVPQPDITQPSVPQPGIREVPPVAAPKPEPEARPTLPEPEADLKPEPQPAPKPAPKSELLPPEPEAVPNPPKTSPATEEPEAPRPDVDPVAPPAPPKPAPKKVHGPLRDD